MKGDKNDKGGLIMSFLFIFVLALAMICLLGFFNEKVTKLT